MSISGPWVPRLLVWLIRGGNLAPGRVAFVRLSPPHQKFISLYRLPALGGSWQQAIRELGLGLIAIERLVPPLLPRGSRVVYIICKFNDVHYNVLHNRPTLNHGSKHPAWLQKVVIIEILFDFLCAGCNGLVFASWRTIHFLMWDGLSCAFIF